MDLIDDINERVDYINSKFSTDYDALVSLHVNAAYRGGRGAYYYNSSASSRLESNISVAMGNLRTYSQNLAILRDTYGSMPKVLVEMQSIDKGYLNDNWWQEEISDQILEGLETYF